MTKYIERKKDFLLFENEELVRRWIYWQMPENYNELIETNEYDFYEELEVNGYKELRQIVVGEIIVFKNYDSDYEYFIALLELGEMIVCPEFKDFLACLKTLEPLFNTLEFQAKFEKYLMGEQP